jgi:hypothetical protein
VDAIQANIVDWLRLAIAQTQCMLEIVKRVAGAIPGVRPTGAMDLHALELLERSHRSESVKPVEKNEDWGPQFDDYDKHANLVGLHHEDIQNAIHIISRHWLTWDQSALVIVLDTQIEGRRPRSFEINFGPLIAKFDVLEPDSVP